VKGRVFTDTTEIFSIDYGDIIRVGEKHYRVIGHEREYRFGLEDPKFWVKRVIEIETGTKKIIKLSFFEAFETSLGGVKVRCFRNPTKEGEILDLVKDHPYFMHGTAHIDEKGNNIRILEIVHGPNFLNYIDNLPMGHERYFHTILPDILMKLAKAFEAIRFLHLHGFKHGDIRNDHIIVEHSTGNYVWIDFDYDYETSENPFGLDLFGMGNVLLYAVGKGFHNLYMIKHDTFLYKDLLERLDPGDFSILDKWRFVNLQKLFPYIPTPLNDILMHFSRGANVYYEYVEEIIEDLNRSLHAIE